MVGPYVPNSLPHIAGSHAVLLKHYLMQPQSFNADGFRVLISILIINLNGRSSDADYSRISSILSY